ncbi:molybdopterin-guanine dinucleotide biosynthesis protein MobA [Bacillus salacetis]|uniref:Molybdopterin-guanine dinucleotide biosynthesis protein MobA n=1 Tax=Bacillus salacetis TaxID=2315464 RepID=A0A3A1QQL7_9BACI|nr:MobQ family relaxase [Bacillus salacetis]RIW27273.1 molybdopterin-guanine dinucleotide biosynthesis protein MobA [Bacillus salacetis]
MAIYHFSAQVISRGKGQSAVAAAAYRSGDRLMDERTGEEKFYHRDHQPDAMILAPSNSPDWVQDRERLWNEVEKSETRINSRLAREVNIALPRELTHDHQKELIRNYVQEQFVDQGMIADIAIHRDDKENPHAHVMLTTREMIAEGFGPKNRDWNKKELLEQWREEWANHANNALEKEGIQDRISHLSHEARGLEQLPTVHLGHIAHEMEKRGVQSERGNINRERQEHNALVVDLQKYREEKKALEQKLAHQKEQRQKVERYNTAAERVDLQKASNVLKAEPSLATIQKRYEQLDKWNERLNKNDSYIRWKSQTIREASEHFRWSNAAQTQIQEGEQRIESISWLNPLKLKENRIIKERAEQDISKAKERLQHHDGKLDYHREKLNFQTEAEFNQVKEQHETNRPGLIQKNQDARRYINAEKETLQKAEKALKNAFVRKTASYYPNRPEMRYMSFQTATRIDNLNKKQGKIIPVENIEQTLNQKRTEIQRLKGEIGRVDQNGSRLKRAEVYLKEYEKSQATVEKYENNPFLKGKMMVSKSAKREYEDAVTGRDSNKNLMQQEGVTGRDDFEKQVQSFTQMEAQIPEFKAQIQTHERGFGLLDAIIVGIQTAGREMTRQQQRQKKQIKGKKKSKQRYPEWEQEI